MLFTSCLLLITYYRLVYFQTLPLPFTFMNYVGYRCQFLWIILCNFFSIHILKVTEQKNIDVRIVISVLAFPVILLSFIKSLEKLAYLSMIANVLCFIGLVITLQYLARCLQNPKSFHLFAGVSKLPLFFGTAIFSFEGIGVVSSS